MITTVIMKTKQILLLLLLFFASINIYAQRDVEIKQINDATYIFNRVKEICDKDNGDLWGSNIFCPALLINGNNRFYVANDSLDIDNCVKEGMLPIIYTIQLPLKVQIY